MRGERGFDPSGEQPDLDQERQVEAPETPPSAGVSPEKLRNLNRAEETPWHLASSRFAARQENLSDAWASSPSGPNLEDPLWDEDEQESRDDASGNDESEERTHEARRDRDESSNAASGFTKEERRVTEENDSGTELLRENDATHEGKSTYHPYDPEVYRHLYPELTHLGDEAPAAGSEDEETRREREQLIEEFFLAIRITSVDGIAKPREMTSADEQESQVELEWMVRGATADDLRGAIEVQRERIARIGKYPVIGKIPGPRYQ